MGLVSSGIRTGGLSRRLVHGTTADCGKRVSGTKTHKSSIRGIIIPYRQGRRRGHLRWGICSLIRDHGIYHVMMYVFNLMRVIHRGNHVNCFITAGSLHNLVDHGIPKVLDLMSPSNTVVPQVH
ncbi:unnamed protein product [Pleuronectes platessa]|uniref:Uncharacterized protein n=1 Tax=Pleuronectes platessa TaxID=8262 RepID=A0A9N7VL43_PLEPL|nr:unnamed protein product [Pleuronectes platessa]